jgi:hypothetical protein
MTKMQRLKGIPNNLITGCKLYRESFMKRNDLQQTKIVIQFKLVKSFLKEQGGGLY